jgi:hypothetical protein
MRCAVTVNPRPCIPGVHLSFDGSLLHGVPVGPTDPRASPRITFLLNLWPRDSPPEGVRPWEEVEAVRLSHTLLPTLPRQQQRRRQQQQQQQQHQEQQEYLLSPLPLPAVVWETGASNTGTALGLADILAHRNVWREGTPLLITSQL